MAQSRRRVGKRTTRRYSKGAAEEIRAEMRRSKQKKQGVKSRKQAIAIGLSKARQKGKKVPPKRSSK